ncbi:hypothetical protein GCM10010277_79580 [Streptomyces longisporoflavus]|nr:hypothetical protein GCM10010277_79580 [Streptomyces longisporoflavus]
MTSPAACARRSAAATMSVKRRYERVTISVASLSLGTSSAVVLPTDYPAAGTNDDAKPPERS